MILILNPPLGLKELGWALRPVPLRSVSQFEEAFARFASVRYAIAFPYGRVGLRLLLESLGTTRREVLCPAYTCAAVAHAVVYSGGRPVFIDCRPGEFNMDLDEAESKVRPDTSAILATSLFGYPVDLDRLDLLARRHPHVNIIHDCAQAVGARWKGRPVHRNGAASLFGLGIGKPFTSVFGGMVTTDDGELFDRLRTRRDRALRSASLGKTFRRFLYLITSIPGIYRRLFRLLHFCGHWPPVQRWIREEEETVLSMPEDSSEQMSALEARVGQASLSRVPELLRTRRSAAECYFETLPESPDFGLPPRVDGATYSSFVVRVGNREAWVDRGAAAGIQLGTLYEYALPELSGYATQRGDVCPEAGRLARETIQLPVWGGEPVARKVVRALFP